MNNKKAIYAIITIIFIILFLIWYIRDREGGGISVTSVSADPTPTASAAVTETAENVIAEESTAPTAPPLIKVYITGAVKSPGVYETEDGARIEEVLALAGGATDEANLTAVNLSRRVRDEQQIIIPAVGEEIDPSLYTSLEEEPDSDTETGGKVDINTADKDRLMTLPGIGGTIADAIIEYRETNGMFENIEEIKNVYRIGDKTFDRFKDSITVSGSK